MVDRDRILVKVAELEGYLAELRAIAPRSFEDFRRVEIRRACERLLQIAIECVVDICALLVSGFRLGLPAEEDDLFEKLADAGLISPEMSGELRRMKGFRNILVHEYGRVNDRLVYEAATGQLEDFESFKRVVVEILRRKSE